MRQKRGVPKSGMVVIAGPSPDSQESVCPVCEQEYVDTSTIDQCSLEPGELDNQHCFMALMFGKMLVIEHSNEHEEEYSEEDAVEVEID